MARVRAYNQDMNMLTSCNSQERTLQEFIDMGCDFIARFLFTLTQMLLPTGRRQDSSL